jgi:hypothetical protein
VKQTIKFFIFVTLIAATFLTSCVSSKKTQVSNSTKVDGSSKSVTTPKAKKKKTVVKKNSNASVNSVENKDVFVSNPPAIVGSKFSANYPKASNVIWTKQKATSQYKDKVSNNYKVNFFLNETKQSVIYTNDGDWMEIRAEILPDQLPQNVHDAIKAEYPGLSVISASKIKHKHTNASYSAVIRNELISSEQEVFLSEQAVFVK